MQIKKRNKNSIWKNELGWKRCSLKDKAFIARNIGTMLKSGLTISESLEIITEHRTGYLKKVLTEIQTALLSGNSISDAFGRYPKAFDQFFINAIRIGETSGNLENNFNNLADHYEKEYDLKKKIKSAMTYPIFILVLSGLMGMGLAIFVLPKITPIFSGLNIELPWTTRMLILIADMIEAHGIKILFGVLILMSFLAWLWKRRFVKPFTHSFYLKVPILKNIVKNKNMAQLAMTLGTLLKSGMSIDAALNTAGSVTENFYYQASLSNIHNSVSQGGKLSEAFSKFPHLYSSLTISLIRVGEKSGNLDESFYNIGQVFSKEVDNTAKNLSTLLEPILLVIIGLVVGLLAISIITPIYSITGNVYN